MTHYLRQKLTSGLCALALAASGCTLMRYRYDVPEPRYAAGDATNFPPQRIVSHNWFWRTLQGVDWKQLPLYQMCRKDDDGPPAEVREAVDFGSGAVAILTLGVYTPSTIEIYCQPGPASKYDGSIEHGWRPDQ